MIIAYCFDLVLFRSRCSRSCRCSPRFTTRIERQKVNSCAGSYSNTAIFRSRVVIPLCGGNIDTTVLGRVLERGLVADKRLLKVWLTVR